jgi:hypothetical protein
MFAGNVAEGKTLAEMLTSCFPSFEQGARAYSKKCDSTRRFLTDGYLFTIM